MASLNSVQLIGHLGREPERRSAPDGTPMARLSLATSVKWAARDGGELRERTDWHQVVLWGRLAEVATDHLVKGSQVFVQGALRTRSYDREGQTVYVTEVRGHSLQMLGGKRKDADAGRTGVHAGLRTGTVVQTDPEDPDIPF